MIMRSAGYPVELKEKMRGGEGVVTSEEFLTPAELYDKGRLYGKLTLPPGASIGVHVHEGEMESFFVISGKAEYLDDSESTILLPGDTTLTQSGERHSLKNIGDTPLEVIALILYK